MMQFPKSFFSQIMGKGDLIILNQKLYYITTQKPRIGEDHWSFCDRQYKLECSGNIFDYEADYLKEFRAAIVPLIETLIEKEYAGRLDRLKSQFNLVELAENKRYVDFIVNKVFPEYRVKGFGDMDPFSDEKKGQKSNVTGEILEVSQSDLYDRFLKHFFSNSREPKGWDVLKNMNFAVIDGDYYNLVETSGRHTHDLLYIGEKNYVMLLDKGLSIDPLEALYQQGLEEQIKGVVLDKDTGLLRDLGELEKEEKLLGLVKKHEHEEKDGLGFVRRKGSYQVFVRDFELEKYVQRQNPSEKSRIIRIGVNLTLNKYRIDCSNPGFIDSQPIGFPCLGHEGWQYLVSTINQLSPERRVAMMLFQGVRLAERQHFGGWKTVWS